MTDNSEGDHGRILRLRLLAWMQAELDNEPDDGLALRKALLATLFIAPTNEPAVTVYRDYLLTQFGPLAHHFYEELHPFLGEHDLRRFDNGDSTDILVHQSLLDDIMAEEVSAEDIIASGMRMPWEVIAERFVACFEIINPDSLIGDNLDDVEELTDMLRDAVSFAENFGPWKDELEGPMHYPGCWLRSAHLSDRIFLFTRDTSSKSHILVMLAAQRLFTQATHVGIGLRGAIASGECIADTEKAVYFGQPLLDAEQLARQQEWFGVVFDPSTENASDADSPAPENVEGWVPMSDVYDVPLADAPETMTALNWAMLFRDDPAGLDEFLAPLRLEDDPRLFAYYRETQQFGHAMIHRMRMAGARPTRLN